MAQWLEVDKETFDLFLEEEEARAGILSAEVIEKGFVVYHMPGYFRDAQWVAKSQVSEGIKRYFVAKQE